MTRVDILAGAVRRFPASATLPVRQAHHLQRGTTTHLLRLTDETPPLALRIEHRGTADALQAVYGQRLVPAAAVSDQPQLQLLSGGPRPAVELDPENQRLRITGDPIPYTLVKQGIRWTTAVTLKPGWLPLHAVVIRFARSRVAIVGRGRAGKSHLARLLLARAAGRVLSDDWSVIDVATRCPRWPGDNLLHIRGTDLDAIPHRDSAVAFEVADEDPFHHESRYFLWRDQDADMAVPARGDELTHIAFLGNVDGCHGFSDSLAARQRERQVRTHLWDDSLSMLPGKVAQRLNDDWDRLLDGLDVAFIDGHRSSINSTFVAVEAICEWSHIA